MVHTGELGNGIHWEDDTHWVDGTYWGNDTHFRIHLLMLFEELISCLLIYVTVKQKQNPTIVIPEPNIKLNVKNLM